MSERFGSRYLLDEVVGRGAMGRVYRARREPEGDVVAVKLLREDLTEVPEIVSRFVNERQLIRSVVHPHVVRVHDLVVDDGRLGIVMDFFEAGHLRRTVPPPVAPSVAVELMAQVAEGLAAVHAQGVMHRDLKPENLLVREVDPGTYHLQLTDFGISRLMGASTTQLTSMIGTPGFMAPEVGLGQRVTSAADVYALGVLLFEWCTGRPPFHADNAIALIRAHAEDEVPRLIGAPNELTALVDRLLSKNPQARPTAQEAAAELRRLTTGLTGLGTLGVDDDVTRLPATPIAVGDAPGSAAFATAPGRGPLGGVAPPPPPPVTPPPPAPAAPGDPGAGDNAAMTVLRPPHARAGSREFDPLTGGWGITTDDPPPTGSRRRLAWAAGLAAAAIILGVGLVTWRMSLPDQDKTSVALSSTESASAAAGSSPAVGISQTGASPVPSAGQGQVGQAPNPAPDGGAAGPIGAVPATRAPSTPRVTASTSTTGSTAPQAPANPVTVTPPGAVTSMGLSNPTTTTIDLAWGGSSGATSYRLGWTESGSDGRSWTSDDIEYGANRRGVTLINLRPGRTYSVSVTPLNSAGAGPTSKRALDTLAAAAEPAAPSPPSAVASMSLSNPTGTTLDLAWGGASGATSYRLAWTESGAGGRTWTSNDTEYGANRRSVTLINLLPGRTYTVTVTPLNASGAGPSSRRSASTTG